MLAKSIGKKYARALYETAEGKNSVELCRSALFDFTAALGKEAFAAFKNPAISLKEKQKVLRKTFELHKSPAPEELINFLCLLIEKKRFDFLPEIREGFESIYDAKHGIREAEVKSAFPMPEEQQLKIKQSLEKKYNSKFILEYSVEPELIGGLVITMGSEMIDGSLKSRLLKVKALLLK